MFFSSRLPRVLMLTCQQPMVPIAVEEPTVRMTFGVNKSPLAGREGKFLTTRMIRDRLMKELDRNVALRVEETDSSDAYEVSRSPLRRNFEAAVRSPLAFPQVFKTTYISIVSC